jgi:hypothetical protein
MTENIILRQMTDYQLQGIRRLGRPRKRWHGKLEESWGLTFDIEEGEEKIIVCKLQFINAD